MGCNKDTLLLSSLLVLASLSECANVKDIFNLNTDPSARVPRDNKYYSGRYGSSSSSNASPLNRAIKPEDSLEAREATQTPVEKRCARCDSNYDYRYPYEYRSRYDDRRYRNTYDVDRYDDRRYDRYEDRDRYDRYDSRRPSYDRYDRYDRFDRDRYPDRYERERYDRDRYDRDRYERYPEKDYDRGFGYDNRGYDYRDRGYDEYNRDGYGSRYYGYRPEGGAGYWGTGGYASSWNYGGGGRDDYRDRLRGKPKPLFDGEKVGISPPDEIDTTREPYVGFRPWDETYKGISGWDSRGRGYYFASGIPAVGSDYWGSGLGYATTWNYDATPNNYAERYSGGSGYYGSRRDPYYDGYRGTSYLYGRPSSTTTDRPANSGDSDSGVTQSPQQDNSSG